MKKQSRQLAPKCLAVFLEWRDFSKHSDLVQHARQRAPANSYPRRFGWFIGGSYLLLRAVCYLQVCEAAQG